MTKTTFFFFVLCVIGWAAAGVLLGWTWRGSREEAAILATAETTLEENALGRGIKAHGALHVEGSKLVDAQGEVAVLRGMSSHGIEWYPRYLNGNAMKTLSELGANVQRLSMYTETQTGYLVEAEQNLDYLYMGIESALAADMYVIVDWHILSDGNPNQYIGDALYFFHELSRHYGDHPGILYEICNEPNGDTSWDDVMQYAQAVIPAIRENAPNSVILVGTPKYCTDFSGPMERPLAFDNIMYSYHRYVDVSTYAPCSNEHIEYIMGSGLPVFVTEWGTGWDEIQAGEYSSEGALRYQSNAWNFIDYMARNDISWCAWALSNKDENHSVLKADCEKLSGWTEDDLTAYGRMIFDSFLYEPSQASAEEEADQ